MVENNDRIVCSPWWEGRGHLRLAWRRLRRSPGYAAVVVNLALGIGTVGAFFAVLNSVVLGAAWLGSRFLRSILFGVEPSDPTTYAVVAALLAATALVASDLPARRAARVDPAQVLRTE